MPTGKAFIQALSKRAEEYDLVNDLAQATAGSTFSQIDSGGINFAQADLQKILPGLLNRATVTLAGGGQVHGISMSKHLLVRVRV